MKKLFTERHGAAKPRIHNQLDAATAKGLLSLVRARIDEEWFGLSFPTKCADGYAYAGTNLNKLQEMMTSYGLPAPQDTFDNPSSDGEIFDLLEFAYEVIAEAKNPWLHSYMSHSHYDYDREAGQEQFASDVNRIFERNGMAFELKQGEVRRIAPAILHESLAAAMFRTGDVLLDELLEASRQKFMNHSQVVRKEGLEKLWDAWERLKTVEAGEDKKQRVSALLNKATLEPNFRSRLDQEAKELTDIGNKFMIRHSETDKVPITESAHIDYLFHRMFSLIWLLLSTSGRGA